MVFALFVGDGGRSVDDEERTVALLGSVVEAEFGAEGVPVWQLGCWSDVVHFELAQRDPDGEGIRLVCGGVTEAGDALVAEAGVVGRSCRKRGVSWLPNGCSAGLTGVVAKARSLPKYRRSAESPFRARNCNSGASWTHQLAE